MPTGPPVWYHLVMSRPAPRFPNKLLVFAVLFVLCGVVLLLWTSGYLRRLASLWPVLPLLAGLILLYFRIFQKGPDYYVFLGVALLMAGLLFLLTNTAFPIELIRVWPLLMTIGGLALLLYGLRKQGYTRVSLAVPGAGMILLSAVFLPFSLEIIQRPFADFAGIWWPLLLVLVGIALLVAHLTRARPGDVGSGDAGDTPGEESRDGERAGDL